MYSTAIHDLGHATNICLCCDYTGWSVVRLRRLFGVFDRVAASNSVQSTSQIEFPHDWRDKSAFICRPGDIGAIQSCFGARIIRGTMSEEALDNNAVTGRGDDQSDAWGFGRYIIMFS